MPTTITNPKIIEMINNNVAELEQINAEQEIINKRCFELDQKNQAFVAAMNEEYGWGNWQSPNLKTYEFMSREEFTKDMYVVHNPAIRQRVEADDIELKESEPQISEPKPDLKAGDIITLEDGRQIRVNESAVINV